MAQAQIKTSTTKPVGEFNTLAAGLIGSALVRDTENKRYLRVAGFADRTGRVGKETGQHYIILQDAQTEGAKAIVMKPSDAHKLFTERQFDTLTLLTGQRAVKAEAQLDKGPSKKLQTIAICEAGWKEGKSRKEILELLQTDLEMTASCANTYYQNVKTGLWVAPA